ncbi:hypothetical protein A3H12_01210 [Candidatus Uhrbacteria bacterium RIFCSPLOWO2_12_FULL_47_9]|nr:MAG: hypothetical protein A3H12_01210 [Candidatus Uhrbacteria bacterium RIFCSPLOWO2_12_FULL_47_9]
MRAQRIGGSLEESIHLKSRHPCHGRMCRKMERFNMKSVDFPEFENLSDTGAGYQSPCNAPIRALEARGYKVLLTSVEDFDDPQFGEIWCILAAAVDGTGIACSPKAISRCCWWRDPKMSKPDAQGKRPPIKRHHLYKLTQRELRNWLQSELQIEEMEITFLKEQLASLVERREKILRALQ